MLRVSIKPCFQSVKKQNNRSVRKLRTNYKMSLFVRSKIEASYNKLDDFNTIIFNESNTECNLTSSSAQNPMAPPSASHFPSL